MTRRKAVLVTHFFFGLIIIFDCGAIAPDSPTDFRIITYQDVESDEQVFWYRDKSIVDYSELTIDIPRQQLLLGARNYLLRLDLADLGELEKVKWEPTKMNMTVCKAKGQEVSHCQNYVRVLILHKNRVFACGTNAFAPACSWRESQQLSTVIDWVNGLGKCPYSPSFNNTAVMTEQGDLYTATVMDFIGQDPAIYRLMGHSNHLRTLQYNSKWLNEPSFVSSYEIGQYIYFFFRESAVEYINCGKSVYSRVARVCKNDSGGHFLLEDNWTTFMKARLNCSLPGRYPFYFDHLQSTYFDHSQKLLYGIFTTAPTSIYGTALCIFNMTSFDVAYSGPFKYQENAQMAWSRVPNEDDATRQCGSVSKMKRSLLSTKPKQHHLVNAKKFQMMDSAVQPVTEHPFIVAEHERWNHIAVDTVRAKHHQTIQVIFIATLEGVVKKLMRPPGSKVTCVIEEIQVMNPEDSQVITKMKLLGDQGALFLTTNDRIIRIPVQRCNRFKTKDLCIKSQDPYCGWHTKLNMCSPIPSSLPYHGWHQDIKSCPITEYPVDGVWSEWSSWEECRHIGSLASGDRCLCRGRSCDSPPPLYEGKPCVGAPVEVTNCTTHGGWTSWSEWSSCSATCGIAMRSRRRTCSNPEPRFDGRVCVGADIDEQYCHEIPICPEPTPSPVDGQWSAWNEWSGCSAVCGGGIQERFRRCDNPQPHHGGKDCVGNSISWQYCNTFDCEELRKSSDWTPWVKVNSSKDGYMEQRFKFVCKANVPDPRFIRVTGVKTDLRFCQHNGDACSDKGIAKVVDVDGAWSKWSSWSRCDRVCDIGVQWRERSCANPSPSGNGKDCLGHGREARECNVHPCQGIWSTWGQWGQCSVTCGVGYKWRSRQCQALAPGRQYTKPCYGNDRDEESCQMPACSRFDGWDEWTLWSECFPQSTQQRKRVCKLPFPTSEQCQGPSIETRMCRYNYIDIQSNEISQMQEPTHRKNNFQVFHLVITGLIGFILGGAVCVGLYMYVVRVRQHAQEKLKEENPYSTINKSDIKENLYMSPSQISMSNGGPPSGGTLNNRGYYSSGSLIKKDPSKMTVKEATLQRNSIMRTNLSLNDL